jgi:hypothetical protein
MNRMENRLKAVGYRIDEGAADRWRVERIGPPYGDPNCDAPLAASGRALALWLSLLRDPLPSALYRIHPVAAIE